MIRLIASDVDGTLLPEGTPNLNPEFYEVIRTLKKQGITFAVASGRQYISVRTLFEPIEDEIYFIADNGAHILKGKETIYCQTMERETVRQIVTYLRTIPDTFMLFSTPGGAYTDCRDEEKVRKNEEGYRVALHRVEDLLQLEQPVLKIAVCCENIDAAELAAVSQQMFGDKASVTASGAHWVDFMAKDMDKGMALDKLRELLRVDQAETMAFGDNNNDVTLLAEAGESYAVANAREAAKAAAKYVLEPSADAVLQVMKRLCERTGQ